MRIPQGTDSAHEQRAEHRIRRGTLIGSLTAAMLLTLSPSLLAETGEFAFQQIQSDSRQVSGQIKDETGEPMIGVSVLVKGTTTGTITDLEGRFQLNAGAGAILEISYIGYETQSVSAKTQILKISMTPDTKNLEEVVVIGYGTVKKRDVTGSVSSVKTEVLESIPTSDVVESLRGRVSGLDIVKNKDGEDEFRIRGNRSVNGSNKPLVIIDGVQGGDYADINPTDIESVDVLKDASSTAIYGSQGANGVIIITTKKAQAGKMSVSYSGFAGVKMKKEHPDYRQGKNYYTARQLAGKNAGQWLSEDDDQSLFPSPQAYQSYLNNEWTDYEDLLQEDAFLHNHQLTVSGGNDKTSARFSLGYSSKDDYWKEGTKERYTLRANIDQNIYSWLSAGINFQLTYNNREHSPYEKVATYGTELGRPYDENGDLVIYPIGSTGYVNPLVNGATSDVYVHEAYGTNVVANGYIDIKPIKGLTFRSQVSTTLTSYNEGKYIDKTESLEANSSQTSSAYMKKETGRYVEWNNIASYTKSIGDHTFGVTGITAWTKKITDNMETTAYNQLVSSNLWWNLASGNNVKALSDYIQQQTLSFAARVNYDYMGKYLLTASIRRDGASVLASNHKWASFPSVALAWRISDESFMEKTREWLDDLKLRATYGVTGNSGIDPYGTQSGVTPGNSGLGFQDVAVNRYTFNQIIGNKDTKWELSKTIDLGFDLTVLKGRINLVFDYYRTITTDMMLLRSLPTSSGNDGKFQLYQNIGETKNQGIEIALNTQNIKKKDLQWSTTFSFSKNKEEIVDLIDGNNIALTSEKEKSTLMIGRPIKSYRTFAYQGIYQTKDAQEAASYFKDADKTKPFAVGDIRVKDLDGNNVIDQDKDIDFVGSESPDWFAGLNNTVNYKDFDFNIYCYFRWGHWGENPAANYDPSTGGKYTSYDYFQPQTNEGGSLPMLYAGRKLFDYIGYQSLWYCDQSFFKIKTITVGYTLPKSISRKAKMEKARIYATATDPFYHSKSDWMEGYDPEGATRSFIVGVNLVF